MPWGGVRQLVDGSGEVTLARAYAPYGEARVSAGSGTSAYGFTGEYTDSTGLVYLRARYYAPWQGRFLTRDEWFGDYNRPLSLNRWLYGYANPITNADPTGKWPNTCLNMFIVRPNETKPRNCPGAIAAGALLVVALAPTDFALTVANAEMVSIPVIGPIVEVFILLPVDLVVIDLHLVAGSIMVQGSQKPCDAIEVDLLPPWGFE